MVFTSLCVRKYRSHKITLLAFTVSLVLCGLASIEAGGPSTQESREDVQFVKLLFQMLIYPRQVQQKT